MPCNRNALVKANLLQRIRMPAKGLQQICSDKSKSVATDPLAAEHRVCMQENSNYEEANGNKDLKNTSISVVGADLVQNSQGRYWSGLEGSRGRFGPPEAALLGRKGRLGGAEKPNKATPNASR